MSLFQIFHTAPAILSALDRATEDAAKLQENIGPFVRNIREIATGINNSSSYLYNGRPYQSLVFFGPGTWNLDRLLLWRESREISLRVLRESRARGETIAKHLLAGEISAFLPNRVSDRFVELDKFVLEAGGNAWSFRRSAALVEAAIGQPPTDVVLREGESLLRGAGMLTSRRAQQLLEGIHGAIAAERENVSRSLFHANLAVGGICAALVVGFFVCAYWLIQPTAAPP